MTETNQPDRVTWKKVWPVISPWRWLLVAALASAVAGGALTLLPPLILRRLIDNNLSSGQMAGIFALAVAYLGSSLAVHLTTFLTSYAASVAAQGALKRLRVRLFAHLQDLPVGYYDRTPIGDTISRCTSDMETVESLFSSGVISLLAQSLRLLVTLIAMIVLSLPLSIVLIATLPLLVVTTRKFQLLMRQAERALRRNIGVANGRLQEFLARVEVIRVFNWEHRMVQLFRGALAKALGAQNRSTAYGAVYSPLLNIFQAVLVGLFLTLSGAPILQFAHISIGTLTAFILLFDQFFGPLITVGNEWQVVQRAIAGIERVFGILSLPAEHQGELPNMAASKERAGGPIVAVSGVSFGYLDDRPVLRTISFTVDAGNHYAIVGRTGAGKSTLFGLIGGLCRPWSGTVSIDGIDPTALSPEQRRHLLGAVPQIPWMFGGTIAENLTLGSEAFTRADIEKAGRVSGAESFISELPAGYDTVISDLSRGSGVQISMGQRQLLALARALVGDPSVLILDEATAAVDGATEAAIKRAIRSQLDERGGVAITIAHRLSTAVEADRIIVMEAGRIVESGEPAGLIKRGGHFASLWELENSGWDWRER